MDDILSLQFPRTIIGIGSVNSIGGTAKDFGVTNAFIITDVGVVNAGMLEKVKAPLEDAGLRIGIFDKCKPDAPSDTIHECSEKVRKGNFDLLIGIGGGSTMDTAKAVSLVAPSGKNVQDFIGPEKDVGKVLPKILVPTTAGTGSEWTAVAVFTDMTDGKKKLIGRAPYVRADAALIDPELTLGLPQRVTADTGVDALSHAIEAYVSCKATIIGDMFAETAIRMVSENLRAAYAKGGKNVEARYRMSVAATLASGALQASHAGLAHCMDGLIVEKGKISHGAALGILLPHVMEFNLVAIPEKFANMAQLMGEKIDGLPVIDAARKAPEAVKKLCRDLGMVQRLEDIGINSGDIPQLVEDFVKIWIDLSNMINPRDVNREDVEQIFRAAL